MKKQISEKKELVVRKRSCCSHMVCGDKCKKSQRKKVPYIYSEQNNECKNSLSKIRRQEKRSIIGKKKIIN